MTTVFIVSAPSGSGKSTLVNRVMSDVRNLMFSVSYTTRIPRGRNSRATITDLSRARISRL